MLEEVYSSGVTGLCACRPPNWDPKDKEGRSERRGVGSLGLMLLLDMNKGEYFESRLKFADKSAANDAIGLRRSLLDLLPTSKYPDPEDIDVADV